MRMGQKSLSRNILTVSVLLVLLTTLIGCSGKSGNASAGIGKPHPMRYVVPGNPPPDYETGIKAVNEKVKADGLDIEVSIVHIPWDVYDQKLNLMMSTGEAFELLHVMQDIKDISYLVGRNALVPIDEYLVKYPNLKNRFNPDDWKAGTYEGSTYAVPAAWRSLDNYVGPLSVLTNYMNPLADHYPANIDEFIDISKKMQTAIQQDAGKTAYTWLHQLSWAPNWLHRTYDTFPFYVEMSVGIVLARQNGTIDSYYESEEFKKDCNTYRRLFNAGLIHPDILNLRNEYWTDEFQQLGVALPSDAFNSMGYMVLLKRNRPDAEVKYFFLNSEKPNIIHTLCQNLNAVSATAENPESAVKFMDWLYANKENHDLFHYGIEGVHYTASAPDRMKAKFDAGGNQLYRAEDWMSGYLPWMRFDEDATSYMLDWFKYQSANKVYSPIAGFLFDSTPVAGQLASLQTEIIASIYPLKFGLVDFETNYPRALSRLKAAGLDTYLAEYRRQFAKYIEQNPLN